MPIRTESRQRENVASHNFLRMAALRRQWLRRNGAFGGMIAGARIIPHRLAFGRAGLSGVARRLRHMSAPQKNFDLLRWQEDEASPQRSALQRPCQLRSIKEKKG